MGMLIVDTFNKGGVTATNSFQSPSVPPPKALGSAKFLVPTPMASVDQRADATKCYRRNHSRSGQHNK